MNRILPLLAIMSALIVGCVNRGSGLHNVGVANPFGQMSPLVYRGGQTTTTNGVWTLYQMGVKTVVDFRSDSEVWKPQAGLCDQVGIAYVRIPMNSLKRPSPIQLQIWMKILQESEGPFYAGCVFASDRASAMIAYWKRVTFGIANDDLLTEAYSYGLASPAIVDFIKELP